MLRHTDKKRQDWFDDNDTIIKNLLGQKQLLGNRLILNNIFTAEWSAAQLKPKTVKSPVQRRLRKMQNQWGKDESAEILNLADSRISRPFIVFSLKSMVQGHLSPNSAQRMALGYLPNRYIFVISGEST